MRRIIRSTSLNSVQPVATRIDYKHSIMKSWNQGLQSLYSSLEIASAKVVAILPTLMIYLDFHLALVPDTHVPIATLSAKLQDDRQLTISNESLAQRWCVVDTLKDRCVLSPLVCAARACASPLAVKAKDGP